MKKSAIRKEFYMSIKKTFSRFLSLVIIVALGVAFYAGIRSTEPDMNYTADAMYDNTNFFDIRVLSANGMTEDDIDKLEKIDCIQDVEGIYYMDAFAAGKENRYTVRLNSLSDKVSTINLREGKMPQKENECLVDTQLFENNDLQIGDTIEIETGTQIGAKMYLTETSYEIVGSYTTPYYLQIDKGTTTLGSGKINGCIAICKDNFTQPVYTEIYATVDGAKELVAYTEEYTDKVDDAVLKVEKQFDKDIYYVLDRTSVPSYVEFDMDAERIGKLGDVVPIIFFLVAALVSLNTMTRMVEEERTQIGTLKALGYGRASVSKKYIVYALLATIIGSVIGGIAGCQVIPRTIINAYMIMYQNLDSITVPFNPHHMLVASVVAIVCVTAATFIACNKELMSSAAELMRPVAPKSGKRVFLERIGFVWKHMNFTWKSTVRNLVRYKKRFFMTIFGIAGSMGLIVLGFGILDSISSIVSIQYDELRRYDNEFLVNSDITEEDYALMEKIFNEDERVADITTVHQSSMDAGSDVKDMGIYVLVPKDTEEIKEYIKIYDKDTRKELDIEDDTVIITEKMAKLMKLSVGDTFVLRPTTTSEVEVKVGGICENYVYHFVYMNEKLYKKLFDTTPFYNEIFVKNINEEYDEEKFTEDILASGYISGANSVDTLRVKFDEMLQGLDIVILIIIISAGGLAFVVLYNLNNINISERIRELATLKVLGFYDGEVSSYVFRENMVLTFIGIIAGAVFGVWIHEYVIGTVEVDLVMFGREVSFMSFVYSTFITLAFALLINGMMHFKLKKIDMAASMKSVE